MKTCIINLGLYRSGTTTLAVAARNLGLTIHRKFPDEDQETMRAILFHPENAVSTWWSERGGRDAIMELVACHELLCDSWFAIMVFLSNATLEDFKILCKARLGVDVHYVVTSRSVGDTVLSELHHWVRFDLENKCGLTSLERQALPNSLLARAKAHEALVQTMVKDRPCLLLPLGDISSWPDMLSKLNKISRTAWEQALSETGVQNAGPTRPIEGILITLRLGEESRLNIDRMLSQLEDDKLCTYLVVLAVDKDESESDEVSILLDVFQKHSHRQACPVQIIINEPVEKGKPFAICPVWNRMAKLAWESGASWVMLLGDDIDIKCSYHYRCIYRAFLDVQDSLQCPFGFGCPWWNDTSFPGFPTFPVVGKEHLTIFGGLIPQHRVHSFWNQDLDPYLQRLYLKYDAAPFLKEAIISNTTGGNDGKPARYERINATGWRDWVVNDCHPLGSYLLENSSIGKQTIMLVDIGIPTYRLNLEYLVTLCSLKVPDDWRTTFIVVVDNPILMKEIAEDVLGMTGNMKSTLKDAATCLEDYLVRCSSSNGASNNIRVRCNTTNLGASASRNRALDESASEYMLFLDDDVIPNPMLLQNYRSWMHCHDRDKKVPVLGLVGMVKFPRSSLKLIHAAVLMSYLTFAFEIASMADYKNPAWGVTANIMVKQVPALRFDTDYAKTGGG